MAQPERDLHRASMLWSPRAEENILFEQTERNLSYRIHSKHATPGASRAALRCAGAGAGYGRTPEETKMALEWRQVKWCHDGAL
jgi:hypothetical protein